jgi:hypothetical protein
MENMDSAPNEEGKNISNEIKSQNPPWGWSEITDSKSDIGSNCPIKQVPPSSSKLRPVDKDLSRYVLKKLKATRNSREQAN